MANENRKTDTGIEEGNTTGTDQKESRDTNSETATKRRRRRTTAEPGTVETGTTETGTAEENKLFELVDVTPAEVPMPAEPKKSKKRRVRKSTNNDAVFNEEQIKAILLTLSTVLSTSDNTRMFVLTESECESIAKPLSNLIAKNDSLKGLSEHSDGIALAMACFMIFIPKLIMFITYQSQKSKKKKETTMYIKKEAVNGDEKRKDIVNNRKSKEPSPGNSTITDNAVLSTIPSIMWGYGR